MEEVKLHQLSDASHWNKENMMDDRRCWQVITHPTGQSDGQAVLDSGQFGRVSM